MWQPARQPAQRARLLKEDESEAGGRLPGGSGRLLVLRVQGASWRRLPLLPELLLPGLVLLPKGDWRFAGDADDGVGLSANSNFRNSKRPSHSGYCQRN